MVARRTMPRCVRVASHVHEGTPTRRGNSAAYHYFVEPSQLIRPPLPRPPAVDFTKTVQQPPAPATPHQCTSSWCNTPSMFHSGTSNHAAALYPQPPPWSPHVAYSYPYPYAHAHYTHPHSNPNQHYSQAQSYEAGQAQHYHEQWPTQRPTYYSVPDGEGASGSPQQHSSSESVSTSRRAPPLPFGHIGHVYRFWDELKARLAALMPIKRVPVLVPPSTQTYKKAVKGEGGTRRSAESGYASSEKSSAVKTNRVPNRWIRPDSFASLFLSRFGFTPRVRDRIVVNYKELMWDFGPFVLVVIFIFPDILEGCFADWYRWGARDNYRESKKK